MTADETIRTLAWLVPICLAIQAVSTYAIVQLVLTGRKMFERRDQDQPRQFSRFP
jgi:hypothetical protein